MLQELVAAGHEIIRSTWTAASVLVKYYLASTLTYLAYTDNFSPEEFRDSLLDNSKPFIFALLSAGIVITVFRIEVEAFLPVLSQLVAVAYLGFLFWVY